MFRLAMYGYEEIAKAAELGIVNGKMNAQGKRYFDPNGKLARAHAAAILGKEIVKELY